MSIKHYLSKVHTFPRVILLGVVFVIVVSGAYGVSILSRKNSTEKTTALDDPKNIIAASSTFASPSPTNAISASSTKTLSTRPVKPTPTPVSATTASSSNTSSQTTQSHSNTSASSQSGTGGTNVTNSPTGIPSPTVTPVPTTPTPVPATSAPEPTPIMSNVQIQGYFYTNNHQYPAQNHYILIKKTGTNDILGSGTTSDDGYSPSWKVAANTDVTAELYPAGSGSGLPLAVKLFNTGPYGTGQSHVLSYSN